MMNKNKRIRFNDIKKIVDEKKETNVDELLEYIKCSPATIRRDLIEMEELGMIRKTHGAVFSVENNTIENFDKRLTLESREKELIAKEAAKLVEDDDIIYLDSSTTVYMMLDYISAKNITVVTNSYTHIAKLMEKGFKVYILGGFVLDTGRIQTDFSDAQMSSIRFDKAFLGVYGISKDLGMTGYDLIEGNHKKAVIERSDKAYVLCDHTKFERSGFYTYASLKDVTVITDKRIDNDHIKVDTIVSE